MLIFDLPPKLMQKSLEKMNGILPLVVNEQINDLLMKFHVLFTLTIIFHHVNILRLFDG